MTEWKMTNQQHDQAMEQAGPAGPVGQQLWTRLQSLNLQHLEMLNESSGHGGYFPGKESHFKVVVVSERFSGLRPVQRHQQVYAAAGDLMQTGIHALAIHAYTPEEWQANAQAPASPACVHAR